MSPKQKYIFLSELLVYVSPVLGYMQLFKLYVKTELTLVYVEENKRQ